MLFATERVAIVVALLTLTLGFAPAARSQTFARQWGSHGSGAGQFDGPADIGVDLAGGVYVLDFGNVRVQKFTSAGDYLGQFGTIGTEPGQHQLIDGIWVTPMGHVWTADPLNNRVTEFDGNGNYLRHFQTPLDISSDGQFGGPMDVAVDASGNFYVVELHSRRVQKFDASGHFVRKWLKPDSLEGVIGLDELGHVFTSELRTWCFSAWTPDGSSTSGGACGPGPGPMRAGGFAVDGAGHLYVTTRYFNAIYVFTLDGGWIQQIGRPGTQRGEFLQPSGPVFDTSGDFYVADRGNDRVQKFTFGPVSAQPTTWGQLKSIYR